MVYRLYNDSSLLIGWFLWHCMFISKATPTNDTIYSCHIKLYSLFSQSYGVHIMSLGTSLQPWGLAHTHIYMHTDISYRINFRKPGSTLLSLPSPGSYIPYGGKVWRINRSANRLLIISLILMVLVWRITDHLPNSPKIPSIW